MGSTGSTGPIGPSGCSGPTGCTGAKTAIVKIANEWRALYCKESPDVRFEDTIVIRAAGGEWFAGIDPMFIKVCEAGSVVAIAAQSESLTPIFARVEGGKVVFSRGLDDGETVRVTVSGIRIGFRGVRFTRSNKEEAELNAKRWA